MISGIDIPDIINTKYSWQIITIRENISPVSYQWLICGALHGRHVDIASQTDSFQNHLHLVISSRHKWLWDKFYSWEEPLTRRINWSAYKTTGGTYRNRLNAEKSNYNVVSDLKIFTTAWNWYQVIPGWWRIRGKRTNSANGDEFLRTLSQKLGTPFGESPSVTALASTSTYSPSGASIPPVTIWLLFANISPAFGILFWILL